MAVAAIDADVDCAGFGAVVVTAVVIFHHVVWSLLAFSAPISRLASLALSGFMSFAGTVVRGSAVLR